MARDFKEKRNPDWKFEKRVKKDDGTWGNHDYSNSEFEEYYKAQGIVPEAEWETFLDVLRATLPTTFRINGTTKFAQDLLHQTDLFSHFDGKPIEVEGEQVEPPKFLPWYPGKLAWQFNFSRHQLRKLPELEAIHEFVKRENEAGTLTRQEAVSMVPPLFLDVHPHHKVLDMCAAPGSKTFQILEMLHAGSDATPPGLVVANDADMQRCNLLTHQTKRICSPCLLVTNHEGQYFPHVPLLSADPDEKSLRFDRILCDVPCCGDGTLRKAPDIWRKWNTSNGVALHPLQVRITLQAARLLKMGGRMVYSTCTFNPVENEAVVAEVLRRSKGSLRLVEMTGALPELKRNPGILSWKIRDKGEWFGSMEDVPQEGDKKSKVSETMFPQADLKELNIEYCMRFLPHHQDTGGFFVCVLEKVAPTDHIQNLPTKRERMATFKAEMEGEMKEEAVEGLGVDCGKRVTEADAEKIVKKRNASGSLDQNGSAHGRLPPAKAPRHNAAVVQESSVRAQGYTGAVSHAASIESDAEGGVCVAAAAAVASGAAGSAGRPPLGAHSHHNQSACTAPVPVPVEPALSVGQCASADTVQAPERKSEPVTSEMTGMAESKAPPQAATSSPAQWGARGGGIRNRPGGKFRGMDPISPVTDPTILDSIYSFYGLPEDFPLRHQLVTRSAELERPKRLSYVSTAVCDVLIADKEEKLKIMATGVKVFDRQESKETKLRCNYRVAQEGLPCLLPYISKQILRPSMCTFLRLLKERSLPVPAEYKAPEAEESEESKAPEEGATADGGSEEAKADKAKFHTDTPPLDDPECLEQLKVIRLGCAIVSLKEEEAAAIGLASGVSGGSQLTISCWRGISSINVLVSKAEASQLVEKIAIAQKQHSK
eukprot:CAMPEP_0177793138 /NCGR_PEP_ID=MMETSP0491_2-20121128/24910_1 /TAXON_ID=63592 /ORGANISM="Tetraselmis chuii, Strain PLY429" /LENGTH=881 /DNA_ID=CAMNT_0019315623 /DNA_START=13 /DNA_END=2658 /DNA_ORIENTATION=-